MEENVIALASAQRRRWWTAVCCATGTRSKKKFVPKTIVRLGRRGVSGPRAVPPVEGGLKRGPGNVRSIQGKEKNRRVDLVSCTYITIYKN